MRKFFLCAALAGCLLFSGCEARELSSLKEISMPHAGEYFCERLTLGGKDVLPYFESVVLTLEREGGFSLVYNKAGGGGGSLAGRYSLDGEAGRITFFLQGAEGERARVFPYQKGRIFLEVPLSGRLLCAEFAPRG